MPMNSEQRARRNGAIALLEGGVPRSHVARLFGYTPSAVTCIAQAIGLPRVIGKMRDAAVALDAIRSGVPYERIARDQGVTYHAVRELARRRGVCAPRILGPRPCVSCLGELPTGFGKPRCDACDRAHHRNGDCACGYAIRLAAPTCARCGAVQAPLPNRSCCGGSLRARHRRGCPTRAALVHLGGSR